MKEILMSLKNCLQQKQEAVLVTVVASSGATPRGSGARMVVGKEGRICGTIGGGAVEYRAEKIAQTVLQEKKSSEYDFSLTKNDVQNLGMICGGDVRVYFAYISAQQTEYQQIFEQALQKIENGEDLWLISNLSQQGELSIWTKQGGTLGKEIPKPLFEYFNQTKTKANIEGQTYYIEKISCAGKVFVFGCGHVAQEVVPVLSHIGFRCVALDDRPEFANRELFPTAEQVKVIDFHHIFDSVEIGENDYVCIMTRGHAFDALIQAQVLKTKAKYIGVIGSKAKAAGVFQKLKEQGFDDKDLKRITTPIGLEIQAETPAEIAISVAAQMIQVRAKQKNQIPQKVAKG